MSFFRRFKAKPSVHRTSLSPAVLLSSRECFLERGREEMRGRGGCVTIRRDGRWHFQATLQPPAVQMALFLSLGVPSSTLVSPTRHALPFIRRIYRSSTLFRFPPLPIPSAKVTSVEHFLQAVEVERHPAAERVSTKI